MCYEFESITAQDQPHMQLHGYVRSWGPLGPPDVPRRDLNAVTLVAQAFLVQSWVPGVGDQLRLGGDSLNPRTL